MIKLAIPKLCDLDFTVYFDYAPYGIIAHIDYHKWNKEVYQTSIPKIKELARKQTLPIYVEIYNPDDKKHLKYVNRCGFVPSGLITENTTELYVWRDE